MERRQAKSGVHLRSVVERLGCTAGPVPPGGVDVVRDAGEPLRWRPLKGCGTWLFRSRRRGGCVTTTVVRRIVGDGIGGRQGLFMLLAQHGGSVETKVERCCDGRANTLWRYRPRADAMCPAPADGAALSGVGTAWRGGRVAGVQRVEACRKGPVQSEPAAR